MHWYVYVHAACMSLAVFLVLPVGILLARYRLTQHQLSRYLPRSLTTPTTLSSTAAPQPHWLLLHSTVLFVSGLLLLLGGATMLLCMEVERHGRSVHGVVGGVVVLLIVFVQPKDVEAEVGAGGVGAERHRWLGWSLYGACLVNVLLGVWTAATTAHYHT